MSRGLGRAFAAAILGAFAGAAWLALFYALWPALDVDLEVTPPPRLVAGLYPVERDPASGLTFAWTGAAMTIRLPGLDRHVDWVLTLRARGARPGPDNPELTFFVDGVATLTRASAPDFESMDVRVPARPERSGAVIEVRASTTFVPGPGDPRPLGVMVDRLTLSPTGIVLPPRSAFAGTVLASAAFGAALALIGLTAGSAIGSIVLVSAGQAALAARGFAPYAGFPEVLAWLAIWIGAAAAAIALGLQVFRREPLRNTARFVAAFSASALLLKAAVLLHPGMPIGDALFHAHRFRTVAAGQLFFTSIAPGNYSFPYAPGLYVVAVPFSGLVPRESADVALLRLIVLSLDAIAGVLLYGTIVRARADRLAGACAVALYHLIPLDFRIATVGNLTNAFAQSLSVGVLALAASISLRVDRPAVVGAFTVLLAAAFLSHTSAFAIGGVTVVTIAALFALRGGPALRSPALALLAALAIAAALAIGLYYAHFTDTYRTELTRITSETAAGAQDAGGRTIQDRLAAVPRYLHLYYGVPSLLLAAIGACALWRTGARDRLTLSAAGLAAACTGFLIAGILTPVDMRHYLAAIPAVAIAAGVGASAAWSRGTRGRAIALLLLAWAVIIGVDTWWSTLTT